MAELSHKMRYLVAVFAVLVFALGETQASSPDILDKPFHLSWSKNETRYDFIYSLNGPLKNVIQIESVTTSFPPSSLANCAGFSGCLLVNNTFALSYQLKDPHVHNIEFLSTEVKSSDKRTRPIKCLSSKMTIHNYCSTHWNPPTLRYSNKCDGHIDWHSPYTCQKSSLSYEQPCYVYNKAGALIDLTPWILSNGSSYKIDSGIFNKTVSNLNLNICNEASQACGHNVAACYFSNHTLVESGFNNLTAIKIDEHSKTAILTYLGEFNRMCQDKRVRTDVRFVCRDRVMNVTHPRLIRHDICENVIEWPTIHACPLSEIRVDSKHCKIKYDPLGLNIDLLEITNGNGTIKIPNIQVEGKTKDMLLRLCRGIDPEKTFRCENKSNSATSACLIDHSDEAVSGQTKNSEIVGSIASSYVTLADSRIILESYAVNKTCSFQVGKDFNISKQVSTRVEFYCSTNNATEPKFLGYEDCTYLFEWGSSLVCLESFGHNVTVIPAKSSLSRPELKPSETKLPETKSSEIRPLEIKPSEEKNKASPSDKDLKIDLQEESKKPQEKHEDALNDAHSIMNGVKVDNKESSTPINTMVKTEEKPKESRMNFWHKFFMIALICFSLAGFIAFILILDKKTQLRLPLGGIRQQARQVFQPQPMPYSRVHDFDL